MRTVWTVVAAIVGLTALAGCSSPAATNTAVTSSVAAPATSAAAPARMHEIMYSFNAPGVDAPFTFIDDHGTMLNDRTGAVAMLKTVRLPEGQTARVTGVASADVVNSYCSIVEDGRTVAEQTSYDPKEPAACSFVVS